MIEVVATVDPNGARLSERIASGRPTSLKMRSKAPLTPDQIGSTMRTSTDGDSSHR